MYKPSVHAVHAVGVAPLKAVTVPDTHAVLRSFPTAHVPHAAMPVSAVGVHTDVTYCWLGPTVDVGGVHSVHALAVEPSVSR